MTDNLYERKLFSESANSLNRRGFVRRLNEGNITGLKFSPQWMVVKDSVSSTALRLFFESNRSGAGVSREAFHFTESLNCVRHLFKCFVGEAGHAIQLNKLQHAYR